MVDEAIDADLEESLYGDLVTREGPGSILLQTELDAMRAENKLQAQKIIDTDRKRDELNSQVAALQKQNAVLITNISSLYKTAQLELERKNQEIAELRSRKRP